MMSYKCNRKLGTSDNRLCLPNLEHLDPMSLLRFAVSCLEAALILELEMPVMCSYSAYNHLSLLDATCSQATLNSLHNIRRNFTPPSIDIRAIDGKFTTCTSQDDFILKPKVILGDLANSRLISSQQCTIKKSLGLRNYTHIFVWESSNEDRRRTIRIEICVNGGLWKDRHLILVQSVIPM